MYERYPISGIKQSYRRTPPTKTVIMPILIAALMGGMVYFYFQSDPNREKPEENSLAESKPAAQEEFSELGAASPSSSVKKSPVETPKVKPTTATESESTLAPPIPAIPVTMPSTKSANSVLTEPEGPVNRQFTPWLSPLALDSYMRMKDQGHTVGFWDRGHWITTIEGRWQDGSHEFRIRFDRTPNKPNWRWQYRINLTPDDFLATHAEMRRQGFMLVQSQSFQHPDSRRRYQAVWQSNPAASPSLASNSTGSAPSTGSDEIYGPPASLRLAPPRTERLFGESERPSTVTQNGDVIDVNRLPFR